MVANLACICGGVGEIFILSLIASGVVWLWRKVFPKKPHKHGDNCSHHN